jgi:hypothetical protein
LVWHGSQDIEGSDMHGEVLLKRADSIGYDGLLGRDFSKDSLSTSLKE